MQILKQRFKMQNQVSANLGQMETAISQLSLTQLLERLENAQKNSSQQQRMIKLYILSHSQLIPLIKNQSSLLKKIFTYENTQMLITYLTSQHQENIQQSDHALSRFKQIQKYPLSFKLPYTAMEALSSECHVLTNLLFDGDVQKVQGSSTIKTNTPLIKKLLQFLNYRQHYLLAGYFSKVILSITKRVFSTSHKYNSIFCECIFGQKKQNDEDSVLFKTVNHLYSASTIQYILKWLSLSTKIKYQAKQNSQQFVEELPTDIVDFKRTIKQNFLLSLIQKLNSKQLSNQVLANIPALFQQLFSQQTNNNTLKIPQNMMVPFNMKKQQKKLSLYELSTSLKILKAILSPLQEQNISLAKIQLLKMLIVKYKYQYKILSENQDNSQDKSKIQFNLFERIDAEDLQQLIIWIFVTIKRLLQNQNLTKADKMIMLHFIQLLFQIHTIQILEETICSYYNDNKDQLVEIIKQIMQLNNNLIQIAQSKLVMFVLGVNRSQNSKINFVPFDFATKLLIDGIISIIDKTGIRQHVIEWAQIILDFQKQHIFQNYREQSEWDHITEIIQYQKQIVIGNSKINPACLDIFYSKQKANLVYTNFMMNFKVQVQYQNKETKQVKLSKKRSQKQSETNKLLKLQAPQRIQAQLLNQQAEQQTVQQDPLSFEVLHLHYLNFDVNHLLQQL